MNNYPMMSKIDESNAPFNEVEHKKTVLKKISVVLTKEIEVEVDADIETDNNEILSDYFHKYHDPCIYIKLYESYLKKEKEKAKHLKLESLAKTYDEDLQGIKSWKTEMVEIDDAD